MKALLTVQKLCAQQQTCQPTQAPNEYNSSLDHVFIVATAAQQIMVDVSRNVSQDEK
jgi:hypothetical protein